SIVALRLADICTAGWRWKRLGTAYSTPKASTTMTSAYLQRGKSLMRRTCQNHGRDAAKTRRQPPPSPAQADFNVPLGNTWAIDCRCSLILTSEATSTVTNDSPSASTRPAMPPLVITSSPLASASTMARCCFCFFCCGRISMKYMATNMTTMMIKNENEPPAAPDAGAAAATAPELRMDRPMMSPLGQRRPTDVTPRVKTGADAVGPAVSAGLPAV